jgi:hypothetical protein
MVTFDSFSLIRASDKEFKDFVERLEAVFREGAASLTVDDDSGLVVVTPFDPTPLGISEDEWNSFTHYVLHAGQLIFFAAEEAPPSVIEQWAKEYDEKLTDRAVKRVRALTEGTPSLIRLWERRGEAILPTLGNIQYRVSTDKDGSRYVILRISNAVGSPFLRAVRADGGDSGRSVTLVVERNDIAYLRSVLGEALKELDSGQSEST